jgi:hypothetical protein
VSTPARSTLAIVLGAAAIACMPADGWANGAVQREIEGRVESVDAAAGRVVVVREFRGRTWRVEMTAAPATRLYVCSDERVALEHVQAGVPLSVFYEVVGADGIANLVVTEPAA